MRIIGGRLLILATNFEMSVEEFTMRWLDHTLQLFKIFHLREAKPLKHMILIELPNHILRLAILNVRSFLFKITHNQSLRLIELALNNDSLPIFRNGDLKERV